MPNFIIAGIGTEVGKTVTAAILTSLLKGDYWKPVQTGEEETLDTYVMKSLINTRQHQIHPPAYTFKRPISPHAASQMEGVEIKLENIALPFSFRPLVIEMAGGIFTPLSLSLSNLDLFKHWQGVWIVVSKHYLGSINHTLLTLHALKQHGIIPAGVVFNGKPEPASEEAILKASNLPLLGRLLPEAKINPQIIHKYANLWKPQFHHLSQ